MAAEHAQPRQCPLCQASPGEFLVVGEHVCGGKPEQRFYECPSCEVAFLYPRPTEQEEAAFYAREFERFMESRSGDTGGWKGPQAHIAANQGQVRRRMAFLDTALKGKRVLEIGCSSGFMLLALRDLGADVCGVEPSGGFTRFLCAQRVPVFSSIESLMDSPEGRLGFDLVVHFFVLEHVRQPVAFLRQCLALLRPEGQLIFEVPSRSDPLLSIYDCQAFQLFYWSVAHHWYFNRQSLQFVLDQLSPAQYELLPEQRYDLSNHMIWALKGKPGGMGAFSQQLTPALEAAYKESMRQTGHCDTYIGNVKM